MTRIDSIVSIWEHLLADTDMLEVQRTRLKARMNRVIQDFKDTKEVYAEQQKIYEMP